MHITLLASGEREAKKSRRRIAKKIKEAQLRKAAARLESEKRKECRRNKSANKGNHHTKLLRSTTVPTPVLENTSFKRSHSHTYNSSQEFSSQRSQEHDSPISSSMTAIEDFQTPISSNKQMVRLSFLIDC
jgi:hypothetical protein